MLSLCKNVKTRMDSADIPSSVCVSVNESPLLVFHSVPNSLATPLEGFFYRVVEWPLTEVSTLHLSHLFAAVGVRDCGASAVQFHANARFKG